MYQLEKLNMIRFEKKLTGYEIYFLINLYLIILISIKYPIWRVYNKPTVTKHSLSPQPSGQIDSKQRQLFCTFSYFIRRLFYTIFPNSSYHQSQQ